MQLFHTSFFYLHSGSKTYFFSEIPVESQSKKKKICSCSWPVSALQTFVSHYVPRDCPTPTTVTRKNMFTLLLLAQILTGQKFQTCSEEMSGSMGRIQIFFLLTQCYEYCFSLVFISTHADRSSVWLKPPKDPRMCWPSSEICFMISVSAWTVQKQAFIQRDQCSLSWVDQLVILLLMQMSAFWCGYGNGGNGYQCFPLCKQQWMNVLLVMPI